MTISTALIMIAAVLAAVLLLSGVLDFILNMITDVIPGADEAIDAFVGHQDTWWWKHYEEDMGFGVKHCYGDFTITEGIWDKIQSFISWFIGEIKFAIDMLAVRIANILTDLRWGINISMETARAIAIGIIVLAIAVVGYAIWWLVRG